MTMNDFYEDVERPRGGRWVRTEDFSSKGDRIGGTLRSIEVIDRRNPEGDIVVGRKSGKPRKVYRVVFEVPAEKRDGDEDDGLRNWDANEAGQTAIRDAYKAAGTKELIGGQFTARVVAEAPDKWSQATYQAKFEPPAPTVDLADNNDDW